MLPVDEAADYWEKFINNLMAEFKFYEYEDELHTRFVDKNITEYAEAFAHLAELEPCRGNALLFNKGIR